MPHRGAPRFLGLGEHGRAARSFIDGHGGWHAEQAARVGSDDSPAAAAAAVVRQLRDLGGGHARGGRARVCHNGLSPKNTVYRSRSPGAETSSVGTGAVMLGRRCVEPWRGGE